MLVAEIANCPEGLELSGGRGGAQEGEEVWEETLRHSHITEGC